MRIRFVEDGIETIMDQSIEGEPLSKSEIKEIEKTEKEIRKKEFNEKIKRLRKDIEYSRNRTEHLERRLIAWTSTRRKKRRTKGIQ